jgi:hypothetical protein
MNHLTDNVMIVPEDKKQRDRYWHSLYAMRQEYMEQYKDDYSMTRSSLHYWAEEKYGFRMETDGEGNYTANYTVTDPKKFMLFQIKYWQ